MIKVRNMKAPKVQIFLVGAKTSLSPAGMVLFLTFFAYGALVASSNLPIELGLGLTIFVFAIPGQVVLVDEIARGSSLITAGLLTTFTSIRLLPLTVSLLPVIREENTPKWLEISIAHFIAVTVWVQSMVNLSPLPKDQRALHCLGFCIGLLLFTSCGTIIGFYAAHFLPSNIAAATLMITPIYFFLSLIETAKRETERLAFLLGITLAIPLTIWSPNWALIGSGLIGGSVAYFSVKRSQRDQRDPKGQKDRKGKLNDK